MPKKFPTFDECYSSIPDFKIPDNFFDLWEEEIIKIKKKPLEPVSKIVLRKFITKGTLYDIQFKGHLDTIINGFLHIPRKLGKVPLVITIHDYWTEFSNLEEMNQILLQNGIAHLHLYLQNPDIREKKENYSPDSKTEFIYPTLFLDMYKQPFPYDYGVFLILDILRSIDFVRLNKNIHHDKIGILGRGLGGNLAIFAAAFRPESIKALAIERITPVWFENFIKYSTSQLAKEYQKIIQLKKNKIKNNKELFYFLNEPLFIAHLIQIPVLMSIGLEDPVHPSLPAFGLFNILKCDKSIQIFTNENEDPDQRKERNASLKFLIEIIHSLK